MRALPVSLLLLLAACGPVGATSVIADAEIATARAHAADGDKVAAYETTSADLYLAKAKEAQGHARYAVAIDLARKSLGFADAAAIKSAQQRAGPVPVAPGGAITRPVQGVSSPPPEAPRAEPKPAPPRQVILPASPPPAAPQGKQPIDPERP